LGCSVGRYTFELARFCDMAIGMDMNFSAVKTAAGLRRLGNVRYKRKRHGRRYEEINTSYEPQQNVLFIVADSLDPPFRAESFDLVAGLNLLDNLHQPLVLIGQMDALLKPGGKLIMSSPYEWRSDICDPAEWLETGDMDSPIMLRRILEGGLIPQMGLHYSILKDVSDIPWPLRNHDRHWSLFLVHFLSSRKNNA